MAVKILNKSEKHRPKIRVLKRAPSLRAQKAIKILVGNGGKSKAQALREAGYSPAVIDNPSKVFDQEPVVEVVDKIVSELEAHRDEVLERMRETYTKAGYGSLMISLGILNKDIELLRGRPTQIQGKALTQQQKEILQKLLDLNS